MRPTIASNRRVGIAETASSGKGVSLYTDGSVCIIDFFVSHIFLIAQSG
ncbi:MAG: hypothetical protein ACRC46_14145 [Thermoguttaceae bacterium]